MYFYFIKKKNESLHLHKPATISFVIRKEREKANQLFNFVLSFLLTFLLNLSPSICYAFFQLVANSYIAANSIAYYRLQFPKYHWEWRISCELWKSELFTFDFIFCHLYFKIQCFHTTMWTMNVNDADVWSQWGLGKIEIQPCSTVQVLFLFLYLT